MTRTDADARLAHLARLPASLWALLQRLAFVAALTLLAPILVAIPVSAATADLSPAHAVSDPAPSAASAVAPSAAAAFAPSVARSVAPSVARDDASPSALAPADPASFAPGVALASASDLAPDRASDLAPDLASNLAPPAVSETPHRSASSARFVAGAVGTLARAADLLPAPAGGTPIAGLAAGTPVAIGGKVQVPAGFLPRYAYWVRAVGPSGTVYGFLPDRVVIVTAGVAARLDLSGLPAEGLLAPADSAATLGSPAAALAPFAAGAGAGTLGAPALPAGAGLPAAGSSGSGPVAVAERSGVLPAVALPDTGAVAWLPDTVSRWMPLIRTAAARHGVDPQLVAIVVLVESGGHPGAVSPSGATGLMQVMPGTARDIAARRGLDPRTADRMADPETNLDFGAWYLADMLRAFGVSDDPDWQRTVETAAAAYNGGPGHVGQHLTTGQPLAAETSSYRAWIGGMWRERALPESATLSAWLGAGGQRLVDAARAVVMASY